MKLRQVVALAVALGASAICAAEAPRSLEIRSREDLARALASPPEHAPAVAFRWESGEEVILAPFEPPGAGLVQVVRGPLRQVAEVSVLDVADVAMCDALLVSEQAGLMLCDLVRWRAEATHAGDAPAGLARPRRGERAELLLDAAGRSAYWCPGHAELSGPAVLGTRAAAARMLERWAEHDVNALRLWLERAAFAPPLLLGRVLVPLFRPLEFPPPRGRLTYLEQRPSDLLLGDLASARAWFEERLAPHLEELSRPARPAADGFAALPEGATARAGRLTLRGDDERRTLDGIWLDAGSESYVVGSLSDGSGTVMVFAGTLTGTYLLTGTFAPAPGEPGTLWSWWTDGHRETWLVPGIDPDLIRRLNLAALLDDAPPELLATLALLATADAPAVRRSAVGHQLLGALSGLLPAVPEGRAVNVEATDDLRTLQLLWDELWAQFAASREVLERTRLSLERAGGPGPAGPLSAAPRAARGALRGAPPASRTGATAAPDALRAGSGPTAGTTIPPGPP